MATVGQKVDHAILRAALDQEAALDAEIEQVNSLLKNKDDLEELAVGRACSRAIERVCLRSFSMQDPSFNNMISEIEPDFLSSLMS